LRFAGSGLSTSATVVVVLVVDARERPYDRCINQDQRREVVGHRLYVEPIASILDSPSQSLLSALGHCTILPRSVIHLERGGDFRICSVRTVWRRGQGVVAQEPAPLEPPSTAPPPPSRGPPPHRNLAPPPLSCPAPLLLVIRGPCVEITSEYHRSVRVNKQGRVEKQRRSIKVQHPECRTKKW
jgi:hypothetical protein